MPVNTSLRNISNPYWYSFILVAGATSMAVEIVGMRFLAPLFGSSLPVWGLAIATVLAGLAWGYAQGGRYAYRKNPTSLVYQQTALAAALFLWMPATFALAQQLRDDYFIHNNPLSIALAFFLAYISLFIPSLTFGSVSPLAVQAETERAHQPAGQVAGRISALTTIGSLVGILLPSFITIPLWGSHTTVWVFAGLTLALSTNVVWDTPKHARTILALALLAILATIALRYHDPSVIFTKETEHQLVRVLENEAGRFLTFDANLGTQSAMTYAMYTDGYWDYLAALPALLPENKESVSVLVLGAAASASERQMEQLWGTTKKFHFTSVELDRELFNIADIYFDPPERHRVAADGRLFVAADTHTYDLIIVDVYARELTVPFHLTTTEFMSHLKERVAPGGIVAININATSPATLWLRSLARTVNHTFPHVKLIAVPRSCNYLLLATPSPAPAAFNRTELPQAIEPLLPAFEQATNPPTNGLLLTDDHAPTDFLGFAALLGSDSESSCGSE